jgi:hypothetical protein
MKDGQIFYLTDKDVRNWWEENPNTVWNKWEDFAGHMGIRRVFNIKENVGKAGEGDPSPVQVVMDIGKMYNLSECRRRTE